MPKLCKPTEEAINMRIKAYYRHAEGNDYVIHYPVPIEVFGLKTTKYKDGELSMDDLIKELKGV
jgi:spermidine/putrescine-binding protein